MRFWINFAKEAPLRFLSHLDMLRLWQRALRRSKLPVAYSAGFNPHQRLSFASALPVGATSADEYLEIVFNDSFNREGFERLAETMPTGLFIVAKREVPAAGPALMALVGAANWSISCKENEFMLLSQTVPKILACTSLPVEREGKKGRKGKKTVDIRPLIFNLQLSGDEGQHELSMLLQTGSEGGARPQEVMNLLGLGPDHHDLRRSALYLRVGDRLQSPMSVVFKKNEVLIDAKKDYCQL